MKLIQCPNCQSSDVVEFCNRNIRECQMCGHKWEPEDTHSDFYDKCDTCVSLISKGSDNYSCKKNKNIKIDNPCMYRCNLYMYKEEKRPISDDEFREKMKS